MSNNKNVKLVVGFVLFGESTSKYLPYFLESLKKQSYNSLRIVAFDNLPSMSANRDFITKNYPEIEIIDSYYNIGFGSAHNVMIKQAMEAGSKYYLVVNPDTILEPDALEQMVSVLDEKDDLASVSPRIFQWDFANNKKTDILDTCGIAMKRGLIFYDACQGKKLADVKNKPDIIGPSGACALYRLSALDAVSEGNSFFDENMFMYKEDCDLAYRLFLAGFKSISLDGAVVYHDRTVSKFKGLFKNRRIKGENINTWSFRNQLIIFYKFWQKQSLIDKALIVFWKIRAFIYIIIFERYLLNEKLTNIKNKNSIVRYK